MTPKYAELLWRWKGLQRKENEIPDPKAEGIPTSECNLNPKVRGRATDQPTQESRARPPDRGWEKLQEGEAGGGGRGDGEEQVE